MVSSPMFVANRLNFDKQVILNKLLLLNKLFTFNTLVQKTNKFLNYHNLWKAYRINFQMRKSV